MKTIQVDNNEILFLLQSMDLKLSQYAEKKYRRLSRMES